MHRSTSAFGSLTAEFIACIGRDLFYTDVKLFSKQKESDDVLDDVCIRTQLQMSVHCLMMY